MDRGKAVNSDNPLPAEMDVSDEVRAIVDWYETFYDTSGVELDPMLTKAAMQEEVNFMRGVPVWREISADELLEGDKVIPTKWVLVQKGPAVRARLVACEVKYSSAGGPRADFFAATPPLEVFRALVSLAATNKSHVMEFIDVKKRTYMGRPREELLSNFLTKPEEAMLSSRGRSIAPAMQQTRGLKRSRMS